MGANNPAHYHKPEQANVLDTRSLNVFAAHSDLHVVPYMESMEEKVATVLELAENAVLHRYVFPL